jgi:hypothetical protein
MNYEKHNQEIIRIISARATESHERSIYEKARPGAAGRHPRHCRRRGNRHKKFAHRREI